MVDLIKRLVTFTSGTCSTEDLLISLTCLSMLGLQDRSEAGIPLPPYSELYPHHLDLHQ